ncbi:hypothetical protein [Falsiroseomonas ponticola]|uniref:hypothetical protein n=1 Tax=Falsiroseomonas ponticola TaxID=2786951 RepID=UPI0019331E92|nr:hypothetical protein [Roseomonas ponticola]
MTESHQTSSLPDYWPIDDLALKGILPHGDDDAMRREFAEAMAFIDIYPAAWGRPATRLSLPAVTRRGWSVIATFLNASEEEDEALARAARHRAPHDLAGSIVAGDPPVPSVVWRVPSTTDGVRHFWACHKGLQTLMLPPDRGFAIFGDGEQLVILAGPPDFLRAAVPHPAAMHREITAHAADMDRINGHSHNTDMLRHYAPVTIDH